MRSILPIAQPPEQTNMPPIQFETNPTSAIETLAVFGAILLAVFAIWVSPFFAN